MTSAAAVRRLVNAEGADPLILAGVGDANLRELESLFRVRVVLRQDHVDLAGSPESVAEAARVAGHMVDLARLGKSFPAADVTRFATGLEGRGAPPAADEDDPLRLALPGGRRVSPRSEGQRAYLQAMEDSDVVVGIGPAGTGKTYLAVARAVGELFRKRVRRIVLARPAVEAGESLGFLPGDLQEKVDPYLRPLYDALEDMIPPARVRRGIGDRTIEIAPLAYMRGRTLSDAFVILDEAQNATAAQMKMFLTRIGVNSRVVITGDKTQIDLPRSEPSGLLEIEAVLRRVDGIEFVYLDASDVTRHRLVEKIIRAYEAVDGRRAEAGDGRPETAGRTEADGRQTETAGRRQAEGPRAGVDGNER